MLLMICVAQAAYIFTTSPASPEPSRIVSVTPVDSVGAVYEVLYDSGGATVPFVYRYFLMEKDDDSIKVLNKVKSLSPFLVTQSPDAVRTALPGRVKLRTLDVVYEYRNVAYYEVNGEWKQVKFDLISDIP
ncbi:hypothetical protein [Pseudomonas sp. RGM2987]|uniref:hypothetical protein n=1 Tax=Pseudomonas sp. RGM2987 TaxID=2930090 RepID=UPI001FD6F26D|nr:hypothetical protein [Pseudomonas sp. RGM2987]MCJ8205799.1 hypothetical protein [Pseudomonas sp. RGM2987]